MIVFMIGGMTWSEVRTVYEMTKLEGREFVIGSTNIINPTKLLEEVGSNQKKERARGSDEDV